MISSISIKNFKSYEDATLHFVPFTVLIGANASGKSNILETLRILKLMAQGFRLDDIERSYLNGQAGIRGQAPDLFYNTSADVEFECFIRPAPEHLGKLNIQLRLLADSLHISGESVATTKENSNAVLYNTVTKKDKIYVTSSYFTHAERDKNIECSDQQAIFYQMESPARLHSRDLKAKVLFPKVALNIRESLRNIMFLDPVPASMRGYSSIKDFELKEDGSNLSSVLYYICETNKEKKEQLLQFVKSLPEQDIADITFIKTERNDVMVRLHETFGGREHVIDAPLLSDGTMRILAIAAMLLSSEKNSLVVIEEIDNGVHPSRAELLVKQISEIAKHGKLQVLVTSHNPALLDALPDKNIGDVLCCYRDMTTGCSKIMRLSDMERYPVLVAQGSLGQLMTKQILERFLKDPTTPEQRKAASLKWLDELEQAEAAQ